MIIISLCFPLQKIINYTRRITCSESEEEEEQILGVTGASDSEEDDEGPAEDDDEDSEEGKAVKFMLLLASNLGKELHNLLDSSHRRGDAGELWAAVRAAGRGARGGRKARRAARTGRRKGRGRTRRRMGLSEEALRRGRD